MYAYVYTPTHTHTRIYFHLFFCHHTLNWNHSSKSTEINWKSNYTVVWGLHVVLVHDGFENGPHPSPFCSTACFIGPDHQTGTRYPEDPFSAVIHGGSSHLLNLDFLNLPTVWHNDKQPPFPGKVEKAQSFTVNWFVVLNHKKRHHRSS